MSLPVRPCPCGSPSYDGCCGPLLRGERQAVTAEELMRSRYTAYAVGDADHLWRTWHPRTRPAQLDAPEPGLRWLGLELKAHRALDATHAEVDFVARSKLGGRAHRLVETSRFEHVDGAWLYVDGDLG